MELSKCTGCGNCTEVCPHGVFDLQDGKAKIVERDLCMECGACTLNCPTEAITLSAGVSCAQAYIFSWLTGKEPACGCSEGGACCG